VQFYDEEVPFLLRLGLFLTAKSRRKPSIVDLGCGDGRHIFALYKEGLLTNAGEVVGVDISKCRIERLSKELPFVKGIVSDATCVEELPCSSFDYLICSQLIEHVENDEVLVHEIRRLLKDNGLAYISSVIRRWYGVYIYHSDGSFKLDPTHSREYSCEDELEAVIAKKGFQILSVRTQHVTFPILDLLVRLLIEIGIMKPNQKFFSSNKNPVKLRRLRVPVVGYKSIEVLAKKNA